jgi:regulator of nucleoside diphosphate kinase
MNSRVVFRDNENRRIQEVTLVYPDQADTYAEKISVLTPISTALIGLHVGGTIEWQSPYGGARNLTVLAVKLSEQED